MAAESRHVKKAREHLAAAVKQTKRWFGGDSRYENAAELYDKAGLSFKLAKSYTEATEAYEKAAEMHEKVGADGDMATSLKEAGQMAIKGGAHEVGEKHLAGAAALYEEMNRISTAGKMYKAIAEMYEESHDADKALEYYHKAGETFRGDGNSSSAANQCFAKVGIFYGEQESFGKAAEVFDEVGKAYLKNNLLKFNARTHFTNALLCQLANDDTVATTRKLNEYKDADYQFADSRECKLIESVLGAYEGGDVDAFVEALSEYDRISKLDPWRIAILLKVKEHIATADEEDLS